MYRRQLLFVLPILVLFLTAGCGEPPEEAKAREIYDQARQLVEAGKELDALREYDRLAEFPETKVYQEASAALTKEGISIGHALESWTIKRMYSLKNEMIQQGRDRHPEGDVLVPLVWEDAWGSQFWVQYSTGPRYSFVIFSAGPDQVLRTPDDLTLVNKSPARMSAGSPSKTRGRKDDSEDRDRPVADAEPDREPDSTGDAAESAPRESTPERPGEETIELKDLLKK